MDSTTDGFDSFLWKYLQKIPEDSLYRMVIFAPFSMKRNDRFYNFLKISNLKLMKCRQILHQCMLALFISSNTPRAFFLKRTLCRASWARKRSESALNSNELPLDEKLLVKGGGNKTDTETIKDNSSLYSGEKLANKNPFYLRAVLCRSNLKGNNLILIFK